MTYKVPLPKGGERYLLGGLEPLTGTLDPGNMIALMGSSGAGKTTLMDVISKRKTVGIVEGLILFDGHEPSHAEIGRDTGYVEQKDTLWGTFTVREMIMYTALLKMSSKFSRAQKSARVDEVIDQMGLTKSKDTKIGGAMTRGVSGGEAKRISIALGLLNNPRILFLDEPTSGLDSATSLDVMGTVKDLTLEGRTVLTTIHQPSGKIFSYYDGIILLSRDVDTRSGNIVYFGEAGETLQGYFEDQGYEYNRKEVDNIAEYVLNIISGGVKGPQGGNELIVRYHESEGGELNHNIALGIARPILDESGAADSAKNLRKTSESFFANGFWSEFFTIFAYKGKTSFTDPFFLISRIGIWLMAGLLIDSLYANTTDYKTPQGLLVVIAVIFITIQITGLITVIYIPALVIDKPVFIRESNDGCYRTISYVCASYAIEAIAIACSSICYSSTLYWAMGGFNPRAGAFFFFMLTHFIYSLTATVITISIAAPLPSIEVSAGAVAVYVLLNTAWMGFLSAVPDWWGWACFISYMRWGFGALMINQFKDNSIDLCSDVPQPTPVNGLLTIASSLNDLASIPTNELNVDQIVCGILEVPTMTKEELINETCPGIPPNMLSADTLQVSAGNTSRPLFLELFGVLTNSPFLPSSTQAFGCNGAIIDRSFNDPFTMDDNYNNLGTAILSFFPQGNNYAGQPKVRDFRVSFSSFLLSLLLTLWPSLLVRRHQQVDVHRHLVRNFLGVLHLLLVYLKAFDQARQALISPSVIFQSSLFFTPNISIVLCFVNRMNTQTPGSGEACPRYEEKK